jgi:hypothetical protein
VDGDQLRELDPPLTIERLSAPDPFSVEKNICISMEMLFNDWIMEQRGSSLSLESKVPSS